MTPLYAFQTEGRLRLKRALRFVVERIAITPQRLDAVHRAEPDRKIKTPSVPDSMTAPDLAQITVWPLVDRSRRSRTSMIFDTLGARALMTTQWHVKGFTVGRIGSRLRQLRALRSGWPAPRRQGASVRHSRSISLADRPLRPGASRVLDALAPLLCLLPAVAIAQFLAVPMAAATVYKCVAPDGSISYSGTPCAANAASSTVQTAPPGRSSRSGSGPEIQNAYVSPRNGRMLDVTGQLRSLCSTSTGACLVSCGNQLAGDPDFGQRKYCRVSYRCGGGTSQELRVQEGERLNLSCRSDADATQPGADGAHDSSAHAASTRDSQQNSITAVSPRAPANPPSSSGASTTPSMKPGLWQIDKGDLSAVNNPAMPDTALRLCVTPEMASRRQTPISGQPGEGSCSPPVTTHRGETILYEARCRDQAKELSVTVESSVDGNSIIMNLDTKPLPGSPSAAPTLHSRTRMLYIGPDCRVNYPAPKEDVRSRRLRYEATLSADGKRYQLQTEYECRYESHEGTEGGYQVRSWTLKGSEKLFRITDKLSDGELLTVFPKNLHLRSWAEDSGPCPMSATNVRSQIVTALGPEPAALERFDREHVEFMTHHVALLDSRIVPLPAGTPAVTQVSEGAAPGPTSPEKTYYSISATVVPLSSVAAREGHKEFIAEKHVPWLSSGQSYAFQKWTDDDVQFARKYVGIFTTEDDFRGKLDEITAGLRVYGAARDGNDWKIQRDKPQLASQWIPIPTKSAADEPPTNVPAMTKTWVNYEGARIEVAVFSYYRLFYDPKHDELIELGAEKLNF